MKFKSVVLFLLLSSAVFANPQGKKVWITIGNDAINDTQSLLGQQFFNSQSNDEATLIEVDESDLPRISAMMHERFGRCGGFRVHSSQDDGVGAIYDKHEEQYMATHGYMDDYTITQEAVVTKMIPLLQEKRIADVITKLSDFQNRYHKSSHGKEAAKWIYDTWKEMAAHRSDVKVELFAHNGTPQNSIILTFEGKSNPGDVLVIGGHIDSIAGYWNRESARAPGADDNASGISTMTEVIRVLLDSNYTPEKTMKFIGYAAEEVGLVGSGEIAKHFANNKVNVVGVIQLDMTNFNGSAQDIVMMTDYTNTAQNEFLGKLIDTYVKASWGYDQCGYGCSDHASWHGQGYPASMPFEAKKNQMNRKIHSSNDLLSVSGNADHALKFSKLALSFLLEMDK